MLSLNSEAATFNMTQHSDVGHEKYRSCKLLCLFRILQLMAYHMLSGQSIYYTSSTCPYIQSYNLTHGSGATCWTKSINVPKSFQAHTKSSGESACNPPTWMKLPSLAKCRCRCSGIADLAILLGWWELTRNSLFRSRSFTWRATASFLCGENKLVNTAGGGGIFKHAVFMFYSQLVCFFPRWTTEMYLLATTSKYMRCPIENILLWLHQCYMV